MNEDKLNNPILMIGGSGRSGTTVLSRVFSQHPNICNVPELRFLIDPDGLLDFYLNLPNWSPYHYDVRLKRLHKMLLQLSNNQFIELFSKLMDKLQNKTSVKLTEKYHNVNISKYCSIYPQLVEELIKDLAAFRFQGYWTGNSFFEKKQIYFAENDTLLPVKAAIQKFLNGLFGSILEKQQTDFYLEKNTWNILWFDKTLELIPNAKLVHIYRDPRDVIASFTKQRWMPNDPIQAAQTYNSLLNHWENIKRKIPQNSFFEISLEDLVNDPERILGSICDFWGIDLHPDMLKVSLKKSNAQRWKKDFSETIAEKVEKIVYSHLKNYGYQ